MTHGRVCDGDSRFLRLPPWVVLGLLGRPRLYLSCLMVTENDSLEPSRRSSRFLDALPTPSYLSRSPLLGAHSQSKENKNTSGKT